jgi:hypothetical protein
LQAEPIIADVPAHMAFAKSRHTFNSIPAFRGYPDEPCERMNGTLLLLRQSPRRRGLQCEPQASALKMLDRKIVEETGLDGGVTALTELG